MILHISLTKPQPSILLIQPILPPPPLPKNTPHHPRNKKKPPTKPNPQAESQNLPLVHPALVPGRIRIRIVDRLPGDPVPDCLGGAEDRWLRGEERAVAFFPGDVPGRVEGFAGCEGGCWAGAVGQGCCYCR